MPAGRSPWLAPAELLAARIASRRLILPSSPGDAIRLARLVVFPSTTSLIVETATVVRSVRDSSRSTPAREAHFESLPALHLGRRFRLRGLSDLRLMASLSSILTTRDLAAPQSALRNRHAERAFQHCAAVAHQYVENRTRLVRGRSVHGVQADRPKRQRRLADRQAFDVNVLVGQAHRLGLTAHYPGEVVADEFHVG